MVGIYKITSPSGKVYIGQSWNILHRWACYKCGKSENQPALNNSFNKYGAKNHAFEVLIELPSDCDQDTLDSLEVFFIDSYRSKNVKMLNIKGGGSCGKHSEETKHKISVSLKGNKRAAGKLSFLGRTHSDEAKKKISEKRKGRLLTQETKEKIKAHYTKEVRAIFRERMVGNKIWEGRTHSEETKVKIGLTSLGRVHSGATKKIISYHSSGENNPRSKLTESQIAEIRSKYVKNVYTSIMLAKEYGVSSSTIRGLVNFRTWKTNSLSLS